ncbi:hypothetical protein WMY93_000108 [Mugilogobius chulae]|uniref:Aspartyl beta-hydroxylase/Triadin domain-containing protein n=1 Tax=Mugilogobius chulae TaxID=88201 RepID=A0AAW0Q918_9GOBI
MCNSLCEAMRLGLSILLVSQWREWKQGRVQQERRSGDETEFSSKESSFCISESLQFEQDDMAAKKNAKAAKAKDGAKPAVANKNGKKSESSSGGGSFFTWFIVLALLGVWTSVAVVYFDLVDYQGVLDKAKGIQINLSEALQGKLVAYDTDGDGDFDVEDAKILLGLKEKAVVVQTREEAAAPVEAHQRNRLSKDVSATSPERMNETRTNYPQVFSELA